MPPSLPAPTLPDQSGLWACGQREDALPTGPTGATTGDYMIEKCQPCNRSTLSAMYPVEPSLHLSPRAGRGGIPSAAKRSDGIRVRGRFRESEPGAKPPQPVRFADAALANPPFTARGEKVEQLRSGNQSVQPGHLSPG